MAKFSVKQMLAWVLALVLIMSNIVILPSQPVAAEGDGIAVKVMKEDQTADQAVGGATVQEGDVDLGKDDYIAWGTISDDLKNRAPKKIILGDMKLEVKNLKWKDKAKGLVSYELKANPTAPPVTLFYDQNKIKPILVMDKLPGKATLNFTAKDGLKITLPGDVQSLTKEIVATPEDGVTFKFVVSNEDAVKNDKINDKIRPFIVTVDGKKQTPTRYYGASDDKKQVFEIKLMPNANHTIVASLGEAKTPEMKLSAASLTNAESVVNNPSGSFVNFITRYPAFSYYGDDKINNKPLAGHNVKYDSVNNELTFRFLVNADWVGSYAWGNWLFDGLNGFWNIKDYSGMESEKTDWAFQSTVVNFMANALKIDGVPIQLPPLSLKHFYEESNYSSDRAWGIGMATQYTKVPGYVDHSAAMVREGVRQFVDHWRWCQDELDQINAKKKYTTRTFETGALAGSTVEVNVRSITNDFVSIKPGAASVMPPQSDISYNWNDDEIRPDMPVSDGPKWPGDADETGGYYSTRFLRDPRCALGNSVAIEYEVRVKNPPQRVMEADVQIGPSTQGYIQGSFGQGIENAQVKTMNATNGVGNDSYVQDDPSYKYYDWPKYAILAKSIQGDRRPDQLDELWGFPLSQKLDKPTVEYPTPNESAKVDKATIQRADERQSEGWPSGANVDKKKEVPWKYSSQFFNVRFKVRNGYVKPVANFQQYEIGIREKSGTIESPLELYNWVIKKGETTNEKYYYDQDGFDDSKTGGYTLNQNTDGYFYVQNGGVTARANEEWTWGLPVPRYGVGMSTYLFGKNRVEADDKMLYAEDNSSYYNQRKMIYLTGNLSSLSVDASPHNVALYADPNAGDAKIGDKTADYEFGTANVLDKDVIILPKDLPERPGYAFEGYKLYKDDGQNAVDDTLYQNGQVFNYADWANKVVNGTYPNASAVDGEVKYSKLTFKAQWVELGDSALDGNRTKVTLRTTDDPSRIIEQYIFYVAPGTEALLNMGIVKTTLTFEGKTYFFNAEKTGDLTEAKAVVKGGNTFDIYYDSNQPDIYRDDQGTAPAGSFELIFKAGEGAKLADGKDQAKLIVKPNTTKEALEAALTTFGIKPLTPPTDKHFTGWSPVLPDKVTENGEFTAQYGGLVIPNPTGDIPSGYVRVTYDPQPGSIPSGQLTHFDVVKNTTYEAAKTALTDAGQTVPPAVTPESGKSLVKWNEPEGTTVLAADKTITATYADTLKEITSDNEVPEGFVKVTFEIKAVDSVYRAYMGTEAKPKYKRMWAVDPNAGKTLNDLPELGLTVKPEFKTPDPLWSPDSSVANTPAYDTSVSIDKNLGYLFNNDGAGAKTSIIVDDPENTPSRNDKGYWRIKFVIAQADASKGSFAAGQKVCFDVLKTKTWSDIKTDIETELGKLPAVTPALSFPPTITAATGWNAVGWENEALPAGTATLTKDTTFTAKFLSDTFEMDDPSKAAPEGFWKVTFKIADAQKDWANLGQKGSPAEPIQTRAFAVRKGKEITFGALTPPTITLNTGYGKKSPEWNPNFEDKKTAKVEADSEFTAQLEAFADSYAEWSDNENGTAANKKDGYKKVVFEVSSEAFKLPEGVTADAQSKKAYYVVYVNPTKNLKVSDIAPKKEDKTTPYVLADALNDTYLIPTAYKGDNEGWKVEGANASEYKVLKEKVIDSNFVDPTKIVAQYLKGVMINPTSPQPEDGFIRVTFDKGENGDFQNADELKVFDVSKALTWTEALEAVEGALDATKQHLPPQITAKTGWNFIQWETPVTVDSKTTQVSWDKFMTDNAQKNPAEALTFTALYKEDSYRLQPGDPVYDGYVKVSFAIKDADKEKANFGERDGKKVYVVDYAVKVDKNVLLEKVGTPRDDVVENLGFEVNAAKPWGDDYENAKTKKVDKDVTYYLNIDTLLDKYDGWFDSKDDQKIKDLKKPAGYIPVTFTIPKKGTDEVFKIDATSTDPKAVKNHYYVAYVKPDKFTAADLAPTLEWLTGYDQPAKGVGSGEDKGWDNNFKANSLITIKDQMPTKNDYIAQYVQYLQIEDSEKPGYKKVVFQIVKADQDKAYLGNEGTYEFVRWVNPNGKTTFGDIKELVSDPITVPSYVFKGWKDYTTQKAEETINSQTPDATIFDAIFEVRQLILNPSEKDATAIEKLGKHYKVVFKADMPKKGYFDANEVKEVKAKIATTFDQLNSKAGRMQPLSITPPADAVAELVYYVDKARDPWTLFKNLNDGGYLIDPHPLVEGERFIRFANDADGISPVPTKNDVADNYSFTAVYRGKIYVDPTPENPNDDVVGKKAIRVVFKVKDYGLGGGWFEYQNAKGETVKGTEYVVYVDPDQGETLYKEIVPQLHLDRFWELLRWEPLFDNEAKVEKSAEHVAIIDVIKTPQPAPKPDGPPLYYGPRNPNHRHLSEPVNVPVNVGQGEQPEGQAKPGNLPKTGQAQAPVLPLVLAAAALTALALLLKKR